eukprot:12414382-Karenia_brevis.AAC.1
MESWFEIKVRAILGPEEKDDEEVVILGRVANGNDELGFDRRTKPGMVNGDREDRVEEWEEDFFRQSRGN